MDSVLELVKGVNKKILNSGDENIKPDAG